MYIHTHTDTLQHIYTNRNVCSFTYVHNACAYKYVSHTAASMKRSFTYLENYELWQYMDYVYAVDIDVAFVSYVNREILGDTIGTLHADNAFYEGSEIVNSFQNAWPVSATEGVCIFYIYAHTQTHIVCIFVEEW